MTLTEESPDHCERCHVVSTALELPPWLLDPAIVVIGPMDHGTWCRKRARYEAYKKERSTMPADKTFIDGMVKAHNAYRAKHQASALRHAKDLSDFAQKWADQLAATNTFQHSNCDHRGEKLGENIAMKWSSRPDAYTGQEATDQWYSEIKMHQFGGEPRSLSSGHFTQVVWKGSREVGVGRAQTSDGKVIVVASYRPAGNMVGQFAANVLPPKDGKIVLPVQKESSNESPFSSRFEEGRRGFGDMGGARGGGTETKSTRTYTVTEGSGANAVTKTIVEETIIKADGSKVTTKKETTRSGGAGPSTSGFKGQDDFGKLSLQDHDQGVHHKAGRGSSSSDSSPDTPKKKPQKLKDFIDEAINVHNQYRAKHGAGKLKHAKDLSSYAQKWAEHLASTNAFQHSSCDHNGERIGENICCKWSSAGTDYSGKEACDQWYSEINKHTFGMEPRTLGSGHFTQMMWKATKEMGIGKAKTSGGKVIVVANYRPAGNVVGHFVENVAQPKK